jgi:UDP-N-acetylglucosamine 2-epimerase (non-hydrolysing)
MKLALIVGTRPNFIKAYAILHEAQKRNIKIDLIHTAQHYDFNMDKIFFDSMGIPEPDYKFPIPGLSSTEFFGFCYSYLCNLFQKNKYDMVLVVGDVNSTLISALAAKHCGIKLAHIEAGLRSFDKTMPEEMNRTLVDHMSDYLFATEPSGMFNLENEGITKNVHQSGNTMIDTLCHMMPKIDQIPITKGEYALCTFHRASNVDDHASLILILKHVLYAAGKLTVIFPIHPRTRAKLQEMKAPLLTNPSVRCTLPMGYLPFMSMVKHAKFVFTDSGGLQEETTFLGVPCFTLRTSTERPITITNGSNYLIKDLEDFKKHVDMLLAGQLNPPPKCDFWDGKAAERILNILL